MTTMTAANDPSLWTVIGFILAIKAIGFWIGSSYGPQLGGWYFEIKKSPLNPPGWVFPIAWTALYAIMGYAIARVWAADGADGRTLALGLFAAQLLLNYTWSIVFFGYKLFDYTVWHTVALLVATLAATAAMFAVDRLAGWLMTPYCVWVAFALYLSYEVSRLNPDGAPS